MTAESKIKTVKLFIKIAIIVFVLIVFIVLGFFVRPDRSFENAHMGKWLSLDEQHKTSVLRNVVKDTTDNELLIKCVDKIAMLPHANEMQIRDAVILCHGGITMNSDKEANTNE